MQTDQETFEANWSRFAIEQDIGRLLLLLKESDFLTTIRAPNSCVPHCHSNRAIPNRLDTRFLPVRLSSVLSANLAPALVRIETIQGNAVQSGGRKTPILSTIGRLSLTNRVRTFKEVIE